VRGTGIAGVIGLGIFALIIADIWGNPNGTNAAGSQIVALEKNFGSQATGHG
jgi:hypothetical protein